MNYAQIITHDIANGPGIRLSLFVSGCSRRCKGCFNKEAQNKDYGFRFTDGTQNLIIKELSKPMYQGITILGGEPFEPYNKENVRNLVSEIRELVPEADIWIYSGFTYEELVKDPVSAEILKLADVLVDGPFIEDMKNVSLRFRGSANQRIIDLITPRADNVRLSPYMSKDCD